MMICTFVNDLVRWTRDVETNSLSLPLRPPVVQKFTLILCFPTHISFRSLTWASIPRDRTARRTIWPVACRSNDVRGKWIEKFVFPRSCSVSIRVSQNVINGRCRNTNMIHSSASTPSANERDPGALHSTKIDLFPWVLVAPYDNAWLVAINQKERFLRGTMPVKPVVLSAG